MDQKIRAIEDEEWIIWNSALGIRDFVTIGRIDTNQNTAWLEEPYTMVGPFSIEELTTNGLICFAACVVMSKHRWKSDQKKLIRESYLQRRQSEQKDFEELEKYNRRKNNTRHASDQEFRSLLNLPPEGRLESSQIKSAYRKAAKNAHPDTGGSKELFILIKEACDSLLKFV